MVEDLRALLRADLHAERPPPLGDVVGAAIRAGRRTRRNRRFGIFGASVVVAGLLTSAVVLVSDGDVAPRPAAAELVSPQSVPLPPAAPTARPMPRTLTIHSGTERAGGQQKATAAAMLHLLTLLLPPGRTSHYGVSPDDDLRVQLYLDDGNGPALVRVGLGRRTPLGDETVQNDTVSVTIQHMPDDCLRNMVVDAAWPDGTLVQVDVAACLGNRPTRPALTTDEAIRVATDPRWGVRMDEKLVDVGATMFPRLPAFRS